MKLSDFLIPRWLVIGICGAFWAAAIFMVGLILAVRFPASGIFVATGNLTGNNPFIYPFLPAERTLYPEGQDVDFVGQRVIGDPVYSNVRTPGPYDTVDVDMEFRTIRQPLLEFGLVRDAEGKDLEMRPWYSQPLDGKDWQRTISALGHEGFVRAGSLAGRLDQTDTRGLAAWLATSTSPQMSDAALTDEEKIEVSLRGSHDIWVVPAQGKIELTMEVQDVNRNRSGGSLAVSVSLDDQTISRDAYGTSGSLDKGYGTTFPVKINLNGLVPGVYRIKLTADDDVFVRSIKIRNPHWVIGPRLVVGDVVGYATSTKAFVAWTASRHLVAETFHKEGLQDLFLGQAKVKLQRTRTATRLDRTDGDAELVQFVAPQGDVRIIADGFFAMEKEAYFQPQPTRLTAQTEPAAEGIQAVLTNYQPTQDLGGGWRRARGTFVLPKNVETLRFVLSAPGVTSRAGAVDVRKVTYTFRRQPMTMETWWRYMLQEAKNAWRRL